MMFGKHLHDQGQGKCFHCMDNLLFVAITQSHFVMHHDTLYLNLQNDSCVEYMSDPSFDLLTNAVTPQ